MTALTNQELHDAIEQSFRLLYESYRMTDDKAECHRVRDHLRSLLAERERRSTCVAPSINDNTEIDELITEIRGTIQVAQRVIDEIAGKVKPENNPLTLAPEIVG